MANTIQIIAEIGTSHHGNISRARELIHAAKEAGADWAKFQYIIADEILSSRTPAITLFGKSVSLYQRFVELEKDISFYQQLREYCAKLQIKFLCTPFGIQSAKNIQSLRVEAIKIASPELNHIPLLQEVARFSLPVLLSTGVSHLSDIEEALQIFPHDTNVTLMHCVTEYPAPEDGYNLHLLPALATLFARPVGVSDHSENPHLVPALSAAMGAHYIEKHITLDKRSGGLDDPMSIEPTHLKSLVQIVTKIAEIHQQKGQEAAIRELLQEFTMERIQRVLGTGQKSLSLAESRAYHTTRRSILATKDLPVGTTLTAQDLGVLRAEQNGTPGLHPRYLPLLIGATLTQEVRGGEGITWDTLLRKPS